MEMTRTNSDRRGEGHSLPQKHDMEMTRAGARSKLDRTAMTQENMEMTRIPPKLIVTNHQDDMEMPSLPSSQDVVAVQGEESGWETMHSPVISVSPILPELPVKTKTQGDLLRENFPSPAASPSPEMTRMLGGMPVKPKTKAGIWDGDVTSFMPVGESTRALKFRVPPPSTFSPSCSPPAKASHGAGEVGDLTSFAPGEEYESTRKLPTRPALVKPHRQELPSPLASIALKEVGDLTTFSPMEEYESTRKLPKAPTIVRSASVSTVDEEVTSPNRGARVQETMLPGLEVTAAPGCFCFASQRGAAEEEEEKRVECPLHVTIAPRNEDKQMGSSLARVSVSKSPPTKRLSEDFEEEQAKRQCRQEPRAERDEGEGAIIRKKSLAEQDREETEKDAEGKESPEKRLKLSTLGERLAALADQSVAQPTNQSLYQPILGNQCEAQPHIVNQSPASAPPTSQGLDHLMSKEEACDNIETGLKDGNTEAPNARDRSGTEEKQDALMVKEDSPSCPVGTSPARSSSPTRTSSPSRSEKTSTVGNVATLPAEDTDVSIFTELAARQRQKQEEKDGCRDSGQHHGEWKLMGFNDKVAAVSWMEGSLMLEIQLGEKLKPKKSRKTMGGNKRVQHHVVTAFQWRSLHIEEEDEKEESLGEAGVQDVEEDKCISEAHNSLIRRFSPAVMAAECLNTYSLATLLSKISHYASAACSYLKALNRVRRRFFPFKVDQGRVTVGFVSSMLGQSLTLSVDFSSGFSSAPSTVEVVESLGKYIPANSVAKIAETVTPGPLYLSELAEKMEELFRLKEIALQRRKSN